MSDLVITHDNQDQPYILLTPKFCPPRGSSTAHGSDVDAVVSSFQSSRILAVDFETEGGDYSTGHIRIVGLGLAWDSGVTYFDWNTLDPKSRRYLLASVAEHSGTIAHNIYFDGGVLLTNLGIHANWMCDTYSLLAMTSNEGYPGQGWGLKKAQTSLLLWESSNEVELDAWLCRNGHYIGNPRKDNSPDVLEGLYRAGSLRPDKSKMHLAPGDILGHYCCLDAEACYLLFTQILEPACQHFPELMEFVCGDFMNLIKIHITQKLVGLPVDVPGLKQRKEILTAEMDALETSFLMHPEVAPFIAEMEDTLRKPYRSKEPLQFKKDGKPSKIYAKWKERLDAIERDELPEYNFNLQSNIQLASLLYDKMQYECVLHTESGQPATGIKALKKMGEVGNILIERNYMLKEIGYIEKYIELAEASATGTAIHPSFRMPGTTTGRLSSKEPNLQQVPKTKAVMSLFQARPGHVWVDTDFCLHPKTEYLTRRGWIPVLDLENTDEVWQVNPETLEGSWAVPSRIIKKHFDGEMYTVGNRRGTLAVTHGHRMLWTNQTRRNRPYKYLITNIETGIPNEYMSTVQTSSASNVAGYCPTEVELDIVCLLQADSYKVLNRPDTYRIQVSTLNKRRRIAELLGRKGTVNTPRGSQVLETETWGYVKFQSPLIIGKSLHLENLDSSYAELLVSKLEFWDGSTGKSGEVIYGSIDKYTIDQIQAYLVRCGYECKLSGRQPKNINAKYFYILSIRKSKGIRLRRKYDIKKEAYAGMVGCVTVPTGCILVRSGGQTFVTGNCALEPTITAEFSQDENMLFLYGNESDYPTVKVFTEHLTKLGIKYQIEGDEIVIL